MKKQPRNVAASVRARLTNLARTEKRSVQGIFIRYMQERLLYRLAESQYADEFVLKGGLLLYGVYRIGDRPTIDIDLLGRHIATNSITDVIRGIVSTPIDVNDGVIFDPESIRAEEITGQTEYEGVRVFVDCRLEQAKYTLQVDIGFGDVIIPRPTRMEFPTLLDSPPPIILVYSLESAIAEKFEAMIRFSYANSRLKDFFDIYTLLSHHGFDGRVLQEAITETFGRRGTPVERDISLFRSEFAENLHMQKQWKAFLKRIQIPEDTQPDFAAIMVCISRFLGPIYFAMCCEEEFFGKWNPKTREWVHYLIDT
jgi:predicted nucleotidyltransferase component of viral defense system